MFCVDHQVKSEYKFFDQVGLTIVKVCSMFVGELGNILYIYLSIYISISILIYEHTTQVRLPGWAPPHHSAPSHQKNYWRPTFI